NLTVIPAARAFEIIALNKQGIKPDRLALEPDEEDAKREYIDLTDQDALTRFDKAKKKKTKHKQSNQGGVQSQKNPDKKEHPEPQRDEETPDNAVRKSGHQRRHKRKQNNQNNKDQKTSNLHTNDSHDS
ncbi:MAG: hypothetical protein K2G77_05175, partial [Muribaculaceae bacterium]|nr:hypothetical protein [Muribaculaceae bacterium]